MKNSSRLLAEIDRKRSCSRRGWDLVRGLLQHAPVELEPGQLPVDETLRAPRQGRHVRAGSLADMVLDNFQGRRPSRPAIFSAIVMLLTHAARFLRRSCDDHVSDASAISTVNENIGDHRAGDAPAPRERLSVERRHGGACRGEGAIGVAGEVVDDAAYRPRAGDRRRASREASARERRRERRSRRPGRRAGATTGPPSTIPSRPGRRARGQEDARSVFARHVEEVEERDLTVPDAIRVLDGDGAGLDELRHLCELEGLGLRTAAAARSAQIAARWVLPDPGGPMTMPPLPGQSGQRSMKE